jgi:hypothetical protein
LKLSSPRRFRNTVAGPSAPKKVLSIISYAIFTPMTTSQCSQQDLFAALLPIAIPSSLKRTIFIEQAFAKPRLHISFDPANRSFRIFFSVTVYRKPRPDTATSCAVLSQLFWLRPIRMRLPRSTRVRFVEHQMYCLQPSTDTSKPCTTSSTVDRMLAVSPPAPAAARSCNARAMDSRPRCSTTASA